jgi:predicted ATPase
MNEVQAPGRIDRYEVLRLLGRGGMGQVFLVHDTRLDRTVALKLLHPTAERDAESMRRFRLEFQAVAKLRHPHVIQLYDWGSFDGQSFFTMEYVQGTDIKAFLGLGTKKTLSGAELNEPSRVRRVVQVVAQTCAALDYVHSQKIVHRDLKPANIMVDRDLQVRVMDFGLLKRLDEPENSESLEMTRPGIILGTPAYLSPEQALGDRAVPQSDLYSLGIILYELLTGHRPFVSNRVGALIYCQIYEAPTPMRDYNPDVAPELQSIVERLLRKEPKDRFPTAGDLLRSLLELRLPESGGRTARAVAMPAGAAGSPAPTYLNEPHLVGRKGALDLMLGMLGRLRKGLGDMVELTGEAGVGKTRLADELARYAKLQKVRTFVGSFSEAETVPYEGVRQILAQLAEIVAGRGEELAGKVFGADGQVLAAEIPAFERFAYIEGLPPLAALPPEPAKYRFFDAVARVLEKFTRRFPMVFVLEHLQWADRMSVELVSYLARNVVAPSRSPRGASGALLLVLTWRDDEQDRSGRLRQTLHLLRDRQLSTRIALERLSRADCALMLSSMLHGQELPAGLLEVVYAESQGNPFLAAEFARSLAELGALREAEGRFSFLPPEPEAELSSSGLAIPQSVRRAFERRLADLSPLAVRIGQAAAVLGGEVRFGIVAEVAELGEEELLDGLDELVKRGVVQSLGDALDSFRFAHPLYARLLESRLSPAARRALHLSAGRTLEVRCLSDLGAHAERLGRHFREAGSTQDAVQYELLAGDRMRARFLFEGALEHYNLAFGVCQAAMASNERWASPMMLRLHRSRAEVYQVLGEYAKAEDDLERLCNLARYLDDMRAAAVAHQQLGVIRAGRGASNEAYQHYQQATALYAELEDNAGVADMLLYLGLFIAVQGRYAQAFEYLEGALQIKEGLKDQAGVAATLNTLGLLHTERGQFDRALSCLGRALKLRRETGDKLGLAVTLNNLGFAHAAQGAFDEARRHYEQSMAVSREIGDRKGLAQTLNNLAQVQTALGDYVQAERRSSEALEVFRELGLQLDTAAALSTLSTVVARRGSYDQALVLGVEALGIRRRLQHRAGVAESLKGLAGVYRVLADYPRALSHVREAAEVEGEMGVPGQMAELLLIEGQIFLGLGNDKEALRAFEQGLELARQAGERQQEIGLRLGLGSLRLRGRELDSARTGAAEALQAAVEAGLIGLAVEACVLLGQIELEAGNLGSALEHIDTGISEASKLGLTEQLLAAWRLRAKAYLEGGDPGEALLSFERAVDLTDRIRRGLYGNLMDSFLRRADVREIVRSYASLLVMAGQKAEAQRVREAYELGRPGAAAAVADASGVHESLESTR